MQEGDAFTLGAPRLKFTRAIRQCGTQWSFNRDTIVEWGSANVPKEKNSWIHCFSVLDVMLLHVNRPSKGPSLVAVMRYDGHSTLTTLELNFGLLLQANCALGSGSHLKNSKCSYNDDSATLVCRCPKCGDLMSPLLHVHTRRRAARCADVNVENIMPLSTAAS